MFKKCPDSYAGPSLRLNLARAYLELERWDEFDSLVITVSSGFVRAEGLGLKALGLLRREKTLAALDFAEQAIRELQRSFDKWLLVAVRLDALARLGRLEEAEPLQADHLKRMRHRGFGEWAGYLLRAYSVD